MDLEKLLSEISGIFSRLNIKYLVTGSIAYNVYTIPKATRDIDIIVELFEQDVPGFGGFGYFKTSMDTAIGERNSQA